MKVGDTVKVIRGNRKHPKGRVGKVRNIYPNGEVYIYFGVMNSGILKMDRLEVVGGGENSRKDQYVGAES